MARAKSTSVTSNLWFIPVLCVLAGVTVSIGTIAIDRWFDYELFPRWMTGGPDAAVAIFETIAVSMVSLATLVLTITMVVVQLAMGQFSPRIVQTFLRDRPSQLAIGLFVATFAHAMLALREVHFDGDGQVPGLAIVVAYVLVLTSIAMLVLYVHHIGRSLRVSALIELVGTDIRELLERSCPDRIGTGRAASGRDRGTALRRAGRHRPPAVGELAAVADCVLHVVPGLGGFVPAGAALVRIEGDAAGPRPATPSPMRCDSGLERTLDEDLAYGFRLLVDMAERSLSDSEFLDPTTAVQCIDRLHDGLRQLSGRVIPDGLAPRRRRAPSASRSRRWTGMPTCTSPSTRSVSPVPDHRRSRAGCAPPSTICSTSCRRTGARRSNSSSSCCVTRSERRTIGNRTATSLTTPMLRESAWRRGRRPPGPWNGCPATNSRTMTGDAGAAALLAFERPGV